MIDLAIDVVAMLVTSGGSLSGRDRILSDLKSADKQAGSRHWRHQLQKAAGGPAQFRQLRDLIPHHQPLH
jgi:hypothetical protein